MSVPEQQSHVDQRIPFDWLVVGFCGCSLLIVLFLSVPAALTPRLPGDVLLTQWIQSPASPWLDTVMETITDLSGRPISIAGILVLAVGLLIVRRWQDGIAVLGIFVFSGLLSVIKWIVDRPRPQNELVRVLENAAGHSFPSGHTYFATVFWGMVLVFLVARIRRVWLRRTVTTAVLFFIALTALSRVYVGAHWPSDVLASVALGFPTVALLYYVSRWLKRYGAVAGKS